MFINLKLNVISELKKVIIHLNYYFTVLALIYCHLFYWFRDRLTHIKQNSKQSETQQRWRIISIYNIAKVFNLIFKLVLESKKKKLWIMVSQDMFVINLKTPSSHIINGDFRYTEHSFITVTSCDLWKGCCIKHLLYLKLISNMTWSQDN